MNKPSLIHSQTAINLAKAFIGESQARNRYTFYAEVAGEEGYPTLQDIFLQTARDEQGHGEIFFEYLTEGLCQPDIEVCAAVLLGLGNTPENLGYGIRGEHEEWTNLYPAFGRAAESEGFCTIARSFFSIAEVEKRHDERFRDQLRRYQDGTLFRNPSPVIWQCQNCGYRHTGSEATAICPACHHEQKFFRIACASVL